MTRFAARTFSDLQGDLSRLLGADILEESLREIIDQESEGRINNAVSRANKGEEGAMQFLRNCFPTEDVRGRINNRQQQEQTRYGNQPEHAGDNFPQDEYPGYEPAPEEPFPTNQEYTSEDYNQPGQPSAGDRPEAYLDHHAYGGKGAICIQANFKEKHNLHTIAVDVAPSAGIRKYDWNRKLRLQLTESELPCFFAVIMGMAEYCKLANHGKGNNKTLEIEDQGGSLFVQAYGPGLSVSVKILPSDAFYFAQIIMRQMLRNAPWLDSAGVLNLVKMVVANRMSGKPAKEQGRGNSQR